MQCFFCWTIDEYSIFKLWNVGVFSVNISEEEVNIDGEEKLKKVREGKVWRGESGNKKACKE